MMITTECCLICREDGPDTRTRCSHYYHTECLQAWFDDCHETCPLCRTPISGEALVEEYYAGRVSTEEVLNFNQNDFATKDFIYNYIWANKEGPELILRMIQESGVDVNLQFDEDNKDTLFEIACGTYDLGTIKLLIELGGNVRRGGGRQALNFACNRGKLENARYLIDELGVRLDFKGLMSPLIAACFTSRAESVKFLLEWGADVNATLGNGRRSLTPLLCAASTGCLETVKILIEHRDSGKKNSRLDIDARNCEGFTALHSAVRSGKLELVQYLVENGANLRTKCRKGNSLFHTAAQTDQIEIERGLSADGKNSAGETPLHVACYNGQIMLVSFLIDDCDIIDFSAKAKNGKTPLQIACDSEDLLLAVTLIAAGAEYSVDDFLFLVKLRLNECICDPELIHTLDKIDPAAVKNILYYFCMSHSSLEFDSYSPIFIATVCGNLNILKAVFLSSNISDVDVTDLNDSTPLSVACKYGHLDIVKYLIEKGANVNYNCKSSGNPVESACSRDRVEVLKLLIENGADFNIKSIGRNPLHLASCCGSIKVVKYLLEHHPDMSKEIDTLDSNGISPLIAATLRDNIELVKCLVIKGGANVNSVIRGDLQETLLQFCCHKKKNEIAQFLIQNGANVEARNINGLTPLVYACSVNNIEMIKYLLPLADLSCIENIELCIIADIPREEFQFIRLYAQLAANDFSFTYKLIKSKDYLIHLAILFGNYELVKFLVGKMADLLVYNWLALRETRRSPNC